MRDDFEKWNRAIAILDISRMRLNDQRASVGTDHRRTLAAHHGSQSVKTTESGGISGYDAGKKVKGRKRHIVVDTTGLIVGLVDHAADIQDRDGAPAVLKTIIKRWP